MGFKLTRRQFVGLSTVSACTGAGYSFFLEPRWLRLKYYEIVSPKWRSHKPLKIVFISDLHMGCPSVGKEELAHIIETANAQNPDIIFLGGDFLIRGVMFGQYMPPQTFASMFSKLRARLGVFSVLGNHDWWKDGKGMWDALEAVGVHVLENTAIKVDSQGHRFWVGGMADDTTRHPDYQKTMSGITDEDPVLLLAHDPASFMEIGDRPVLTLCGHTHGGQVTIPYISPIIIPGRAPLKYAYGHIKEQGREMIVTSGVGTSVLPVRFGRRPEVVVITVVAPA